MMSSFLSSSYFGYQPSVICRLGENFSHSVSCLFVILTVSFALQKFFSFMRSHLVILGTALLVSVQEIVFCSNGFKAISHFLFYQVQCIWFYVDIFDTLEGCAKQQIQIYLHSTTCRHQNKLTPFVKDAFFFLLHIIDFFIKNQESTGVWIYVWVFDLIPLTTVSIFMPISCSFNYYSSVVELEIRDGDISGSSFIV